MTYALNTSHALYPYLHELIGVENGALVSLKTARTFTKHADATFGTGTYGEHFKSLANQYTPRGATMSPAVAFSTITRPNMTLVVVVNSVGAAQQSSQFFGTTGNTPSIHATAGFLGASSGPTQVGPQGTVKVIDTAPHVLSLARVGETSYEARVDGALSASGARLSWNGAGTAWSYIGGHSGLGSVTAEFVWIAWFTKTLTTTELSDLQASLGANNTFALVQSAPPDTTAPTLTSPTATATGATTASGSVSTNEANGTLYYLASANATELAATVKAGSSQAVTATGEQPVTITGLTAATPYYPHYLHRDAAGNDSAVASGAQFTTAAANTSPSFTGPNIADISGTQGVVLTPVDVSAKFYDAESGLTFRAIGSWPAGVTVSSAGVISGAPTTAGAYAGLQVQATDAGSLTADSNAFTITVAAAAVSSVTSEEFKNNTGTLLPSATIPKVWLIPFGAPDYTNLVTNGAGELVISEAGLSGDYLIVTANADGTEVGVSKATAS